jgi:hypothetical protein
MRVAKLLPLFILCLASSLATAEERNCSDLENRQARQECMQRKANADVDCSTINDSQARRECAQRKQQNSADCSKLATPEMRQQCLNQKAK